MAGTVRNFGEREHRTEQFCPGHAVYCLGCGKIEGEAYLTCGKAEDLSIICGHN